MKLGLWLWSEVAAMHFDLLKLLNSQHSPVTYSHAHVTGVACM